MKIAALVVEGEMHNLVAVDTGELDESIQTFPVKRTIFGFEVEIGTRGVEHAKFVERGVRNKVYNYHKRKGQERTVIFTGVGQHFASRSLKNTKQRILSILNF